MGKSNINSVKQILENIKYEAETMKQHIEIHKDNSTLFTIGSYMDGDTQHIFSIMLGRKFELIESVLACMNDNDDFRDLIFESFKEYLTRSKNVRAAVIKVSSGSLLSNILNENFGKIFKEGKEDNDEQ